MRYFFCVAQCWHCFLFPIQIERNEEWKCSSFSDSNWNFDSLSGTFGISGTMTFSRTNVSFDSLDSLLSYRKTKLPNKTKSFLNPFFLTLQLMRSRWLAYSMRRQRKNIFCGSTTSFCVQSFWKNGHFLSIFREVRSVDETSLMKHIYHEGILE